VIVDLKALALLEVLLTRARTNVLNQCEVALVEFLSLAYQAMAKNEGFVFVGVLVGGDFTEGNIITDGEKLSDYYEAAGRLQALSLKLAAVAEHMESTADHAGHGCPLDSTSEDAPEPKPSTN